MVGRPRTVSDDEIFVAVAETVSDHGPDGLTLAAVAAKVGLSGPAVRQRFGSKRELLVAFAAHNAATATDPFDRTVAENDGPLAALYTAMVTAASAFGNRSSVANHLAMLHLDLTDPELGTLAAEHGRLFKAALAELVAAAVAAGELSSTDPEATVELLYTTYNGAIVTWALDGRGTLADWLTDRVSMVIDPLTVS